MVVQFRKPVPSPRPFKPLSKRPHDGLTRITVRELHQKLDRLGKLAPERLAAVDYLVDLMIRTLTIVLIIGG